MTITKNSTLNVLMATTVLIWAALFFYFVCLTYIKGPYADEWSILYFFKEMTENGLNLHSLFERFYGAHVFALPRLLLVVEYFLFKGTAIFPKIFALALLASTFYIFYINIKTLSISSLEINILLFFGFIIVFDAPQLITFSFPSAGFQHTGGIFFSFLAIHIFSRDIQKNVPITTARIALYLLLSVVAGMFTAVGLPGIGVIFFGLMLYKAPRKQVFLYFVCMLALAYLFKPDDIIIRASETLDITVKLSIKQFLIHGGLTPAPFYPFFFIYLFGYTGALVSLFLSSLSMTVGAVLFFIFCCIFILSIQKKQKDLIFFQLTLLAMLGYAALATWGRYPVNDGQFDRFVTIYPWLIWSGLILWFILHQKSAKIFCVCILMTQILTAHTSIKSLLSEKHNMQQVDINMINKSFIHMADKKVSIILTALKFSPEYFHEFQKARNWGVYHFPFNPDLSKITDDQCDAIKLHEFIVSEKKFVEYKLDGWNTTKEKPLDYIYALNNDNIIVAYGISMARKPSALPLFMLPRNDVMVYIVVPRQYSLGELRLVGGDQNNYCEIKLIKKPN